MTRADGPQIDIKHLEDSGINLRVNDLSLCLCVCGWCVSVLDCTFTELIKKLVIKDQW